MIALQSASLPRPATARPLPPLPQRPARVLQTSSAPAQMSLFVRHGTAR